MTTETTTSGPKYPGIKVQLTGQDGNAFFILGSVQKAMKAAKVHPDTIAEFIAEAQSGDYDELLRTVMRWVTVR